MQHIRVLDIVFYPELAIPKPQAIESTNDASAYLVAAKGYLCLTVFEEGVLMFYREVSSKHPSSSTHRVSSRSHLLS